MRRLPFRGASLSAGFVFLLLGIAAAPAAAAGGDPVGKFLRRADKQYRQGDLDDALELYRKADEAAGGSSLAAVEGLCRVALDRAQPTDELEKQDVTDGESGARVLEVGGDVTQPTRVHSPPPEYTEAARWAKIQGQVVVRALLDEQGTVACARVLRGVERELDRATLATVKQWRFEPARLNGVPVPVVYNLTVTFGLEWHMRVQHVPGPG